MKKGMIGIILMSVGALLLVVGFIAFKKSGENNATEVATASKDGATQSDVRSQKENLAPGDDSANLGMSKRESSIGTNQVAVSGSQPPKGRTAEIDRLIDMAIADGVLTQNEKNKIQALATEHNLEYEEMLEIAESRMAELGIDSETELVDINRKNGLNFEKFIVQKFDKRFFKITNWAGDKYVNGYYAEVNQQPDIQLNFSLGNRTSKLAVECKWRKKFFQNGIKFASEEQFDRYRKFASTNDIPVFVAIGVGGSGASPDRLYIVDLSKCQSNFITIDQLSRYKKQLDKDFYFDPQKEALR